MTAKEGNGRQPLIIVVSSPSGGGKTTIINRLLTDIAGIKRSVSCTTRTPREGEEEGVDYFFISEEEFTARIGRNEFLEWEKNFGHYYGTSGTLVKKMMEEGSDIILSIDVKGARRAKEKLPESVSIFIMPPSQEELSERLKKRNTDKKDQVAARLGESKKEIDAADEYDYMVINKDLSDAVREIKEIITQERNNRNKKKG